MLPIVRANLLHFEHRFALFLAAEPGRASLPRRRASADRQFSPTATPNAAKASVPGSGTVTPN